MNEKNDPKEFILGNKNVAEPGSHQFNLTLIDKDPDAIAEILNMLKEYLHFDKDLTCTVFAGVNRESHHEHVAKKRPVARIVTETFTYRWFDHPDGHVRLIRLYQYLTAKPLCWLDPATTPEQWEALFTGAPKSFTLKWLGTQMQLKHLFRLMLDRTYITNDNSFGHWEILGSHFLDHGSKPFTTEWNKVSTPRSNKAVFDQLAEVLNIAGKA